MDYKTEEKLRFSYNDKLFDLLKFNEFLADKKFIRRLATNKSQMLFGYLKDIRFYRKFINECEKRYPSFDIENIRKNCIIVEGFSNEILYISIKDKYDIKTLEEIKNMHFDVAIMNPPYDGNLHLKILECVIPNADKVVNISPIGWLQCRYNVSNFPEVRKHIKTVDVIDMVEACHIFNAGFNCDVGIYEFDTKEYDFTLLDKNILEIFKKTDKQDSLYNHVENDKRDGWRMQISEIQPITAQGGHKGSYGWFCRFAIYNHLRSTIYKNGYKDGKDWTYYNSGIKQPEGSGMQWSFKFKTENEAKNFENSLKTTFYHFLVLKTKWNQHTPFKYLPYMGDYTKPWTNERFCKYFGITGYISDTEAEPNSEWETILNTMKEYE